MSPESDSRSPVTAGTITATMTGMKIAITVTISAGKKRARF